MPEDVRFTGLRVDVAADLHDVILLPLRNVLPATHHPPGPQVPAVWLPHGSSYFARRQGTHAETVHVITHRANAGTCGMINCR